MHEKTLVITIGQLRAADLTWSNFRRNVLEPLNADLAVCTPLDNHFQLENPFYQGAKYKWLVPAPSDFSDLYDSIQRLLADQPDPAGDWRQLCGVRGDWLGGIKLSGQHQYGAGELAFRWFVGEHIKSMNLHRNYDRFILTRSDFIYAIPHPPLAVLSPPHLWIPNGEDFGGVCTRHLVASSEDIVQVCDTLGMLLRNPAEITKRMLVRDTYWHVEKVLRLHFEDASLFAKIRRFPYTMYLVRSPSDPTTTVTGRFVEEVGMFVKYESEYMEALRYKDRIQNSEDWKELLKSDPIPSPSRIYTVHGTVAYVDEETGELRHGPLATSPANAMLVSEEASIARIQHQVGDASFGLTIEPTGTLRSPYPHNANDGAAFSVARLPTMDLPHIRGSANDLVALQKDELFISAEPHGRIVVDKPHCRAWEQFRLIGHRVRAQ